MTNNTKILLINTPVLAVLEPWFDAPKFVRTALAALAGYIRANSNHEISCLDAKFEGLSFEETVQRAKKIQPDIIGLTAFTNEIKPGAYLAGLLKKELPNTIIVCGGAHLTAIPEQTMHEFPTFDIGVVGEGEQTLLELTNAIANKLPLDNVTGIVFRKENGALHTTPSRARMLSLEQLPMPAWDLMPSAEEYYIQTERGCPFACVFCLNHNGKVARKRGVDTTLDEMEWLIQYGAKRISFGDELFSVDMVRAEQIIEGMIERKIGERVSWDIQTHVAFVNDNLFKKMKAANIEKCEMGVEAGDEFVLKRMGKATTREMIIKAFSSAKKHGVKTGSFFIIGQPNETYKSIWQSIRFAIQLNPTEPIFGTMVPYPGTEVARMAAAGENGYKLVTTNWDEYRKQLNGSMELTHISRTQLEWMQIFGYVSVFLANFRFLDFLRFFWSYRTGAINLFKKALTGKTSTHSLVNKPANYEEVIGSPGNISMDEILKSREYWKKYQSAEIQRTKELMPQLLKEQMPI
jgi:anaerobic magnesium-protoporphyrin IX monomethyl ester cyclase